MQKLSICCDTNQQEKLCKTIAINFYIFLESFKSNPTMMFRRVCQQPLLLAAELLAQGLKLCCYHLCLYHWNVNFHAHISSQTVSKGTEQPGIRSHNRTHRNQLHQDNESEIGKQSRTDQNISKNRFSQSTSLHDNVFFHFKINPQFKFY